MNSLNKKNPKYMKKKKCNPYNIEDVMLKYNISKEEAEQRISEYKKKTGSSYNIESMMSKYNISKEEAEQLVNERKKNTSMVMKKTITIDNLGESKFKAMNPKNKEHWINKGYSEKESIKLAKKQIQHMKSFAYKDLEINPDKYKYSFNCKIEYWIKKGYSEEEAKLKLSERQRTFTKQKCIDKHGEEKGLQVWNDRQEKWQSTLNAKSDEEKQRINSRKALTKINFIHKYGEVEGTKKFNEYNKSKSVSFSKTASTLFEDIIKRFSLDRNIVQMNNNEFYIADSEKIYFYDFKYLNKIIEFNGDFWHMNPSKYSADAINKRTKLTAENIWKKDDEKIKMALNEGFEVLVIWESELKEYDILWQKINNFFNKGKKQ